MLLFLVTPCLVVAVQPCKEWIPIKKTKLRFDHGILQGRMTNKNHYILLYIQPEGLLLQTCQNDNLSWWVLTPKSHHPFIDHVLKTITSPLPQFLWPPNLLGADKPWQAPNHSHTKLWLRGLARSHDKQKPIDLDYKSTYDFP